MSTALFRKAEMEALGKRYAALLMRNARASPEDMPELCKHRQWQGANSYTRADICKALKEKARALLQEAGYAPALIDTILNEVKP